MAEQYEYRVFDPADAAQVSPFEMQERAARGEEHGWETELNRLGAEGWRVVSVVDLRFFLLERNSLAFR